MSILITITGINKESKEKFNGLIKNAIQKAVIKCADDLYKETRDNYVNFINDYRMRELRKTALRGIRK